MYEERRKNDNYNKTSDVFKTSDDSKKVLRYTHDSFVKELIGKTIRIEFINNKIITGKLLELGVYDIVVQINVDQEVEISGKKVVKSVQKNIILMKAPILSVEVM